VPAIASELFRRHYRRGPAADAAPTPGSGRRRWRPRWTLRLRLTLLYGAVFLLAGTVLLAITYGLVANGTTETVQVNKTGQAASSPVLKSVPAKAVQLPRVPPGSVDAYVLQAYRGRVTALIERLGSAQAKTFNAQNLANLKHQRNLQLNTLLTRSGIALVLMAFISIGLGWVMAGRALRPVRTMSARARGISERNLHERLALEGPNDELKELGDTFDGLLARLEKAFESQRQFVANASHELRTPMTLERTLVEVALADPEPTVASLRRTCERVLVAREQQERLTEALLTLARSQRGLAVREPLDLGAVAGDVLQGVEPDGIRLERELGDARTAGDPALVERLVANLLDNAVHYNTAGGWVRVWTGLRDGRPTLAVVNSGLPITADEAATLAEPFRRLNGDRPAAEHNGLGLGLSIVGAIATAHDADLRMTPRPAGGLSVEARFPLGTA
jgi:signal transduction histidine kinase